jgi:capsule biosynthesis phosphatase
MNIIIPLGGLGVRFRDEQYLMPKPLIKVLGKELIFHLLDRLVFTNDDSVFMIIGRELEKFNFSNTIHAKYPRINILFLDKQTEGAVETVLIGINQILKLSDNNKQPTFIDGVDACLDLVPHDSRRVIKKHKKTVLLDCDNFYTIDILKMFRNNNDKCLGAQESLLSSGTKRERTCLRLHESGDGTTSQKCGDNAIMCFKDNQSNPIYSYLKFDNNLNISEIKEKVRISDYANTGCYCFADLAVLHRYCAMIIEQNIRQKNEYYMSGLVQKMIEDGYCWKALEIPIEDYHCLGTPFQLKLYCSKNILEAEKKRICFDLDNTLVTTPQLKGDYSTVQPIIKNIEYLRFLHKLGHTIIIFTARRMKTHSGNAGKIMKDVGRITLDTLDKFDIPYDELYFGKPYADFYVDDLAVNSNFDLEKEIGIYKTGIQERSFNEISSHKIDVVTKKSRSPKLQGEIFWYRNIPNDLRDLFPALLSYGSDYYTTEKINGITFSYLFVNESLSVPIFRKFLDSILRIHSCALPSSKVIKSGNDNSSDENSLNIYANYAAKLQQRYGTYDYKGKFGDCAKSVYEGLLLGLQEYEENGLGTQAIIHGDPVFSNVLLDSHNNIKLIDMRGLLGESICLEGDIFYDYAKIYQSLCGYDEILLGKMVSIRYKQTLFDEFDQFITHHYGPDRMRYIKLLTDSMFFTLIPLHDNEKCKEYFRLISIQAGNPLSGA